MLLVRIRAITDEEGWGKSFSREVGEENTGEADMIRAGLKRMSSISHRDEFLALFHKNRSYLLLSWLEWEGHPSTGQLGGREARKWSSDQDAALKREPGRWSLAQSCRGGLSPQLFQQGLAFKMSCQR